MKRSGVADLPLHGGRVPAWLASPKQERLQMWDEATPQIDAIWK